MEKGEEIWGSKSALETGGRKGRMPGGEVGKRMRPEAGILQPVGQVTREWRRSTGKKCRPESPSLQFPGKDTTAYFNQAPRRAQSIRCARI